MVRKDVRGWRENTSLRRQIEMTNRLKSEKAPTSALFDLPAAPPSLANLKVVKAEQNKATAKLTYYGKVDFGVGGEPTDNLYVLSFVEERGGWKYDGAEFVNLMALPDVRKQLNQGDRSYLDGDDFRADGRVPKIPPQVGNVEYVAKVYSFCPGRAVDVTVNGASQHRFQNTQDAQVVIGGAKGGKNSISFKIRELEGGTGKEAFTVRVYLMNEKAGAKPVKVYEYLVQEGGNVAGSRSAQFIVSPAHGKAVRRK